MTNNKRWLDSTRPKRGALDEIVSLRRGRKEREAAQSNEEENK